jgi:hypothetical protein
MGLVLAVLFVTAPSAEAAGFHFFKVEGLATVASAGDYAGGVGLSPFSDLFHGWVTFGDPAGDGRIVREGWIESRRLGPVLGVVPPDFEDMVPHRANAWIVPWSTWRAGGNADQRRSFELAFAQHAIVNGLAFAGADPRRAFVGPDLGVGLEGTWWRGWKDVDGANVMTGKLTGQAGLAAGVTVRDTWYAQARSTARIDLFGAHQTQWLTAGDMGIFLDRVGVPFGVEVRGELELGDDNVHARDEARWSALAMVYWKLTPPFQTRIEEAVEREAMPMAR